MQMLMYLHEDMLRLPIQLAKGVLRHPLKVQGRAAIEVPVLPVGLLPEVG
jgi:hypothetical protein